MFLLVLTVFAFSDSLRMVEPEAVGLSTERLLRIDKVMEKHVAQQKIAGGVILLARHGKTAHLGAYGMMDVEAGKPMLGIFMCQLHPGGSDLAERIRILSYQAIID